MPKYKVLSLAMVFAAASAQAQNPFEAVKAFSATFVVSGISSMHQGKAEAKMYRSGSLLRTDLPGGSGYTIVDTGQHTSYIVMGGGMCMSMAGKEQQNPFAQAPDADIERTPAGTDTVDGHACKVENLTITPRSGPRAGQAVKMKVWEAEDLHGFPLKVEMQTARGLITTQYKDITLAEPDASLFVHPDNCRQMPALPGMPGAGPR